MAIEIDDLMDAELLDVEEIMRRIRAHIAAKSAGAVGATAATTAALAVALQPDCGGGRFGESLAPHMAELSRAAGDVAVTLVVTHTRTPIIGPALDRVRTKVHQLVLFYVNQMAARQMTFNAAVIRALVALATELDTAAQSEAEPGAAPVPREKMKIAFVIPWYGAGIPGGAEAEVRRTAEHLCRAGLLVEVIATCARDLYADWSENHHRPGLTVEDGVPVRRFPVGPRDRQAFDAVNLKLMHNLAITPAEETAYWRHHVNSPALLDFIQAHLHEYLFIFIPYLHGTTYAGLQVCAGRGVLIPCLHDESYARLAGVAELMGLARRLILHSPAEQALAELLFHPRPGLALLLGEGVATGFASEAGRFRQRYAIDTPFILCAGRKDPGKNVDLLVNYFRRYRSERNVRLELVLLGGGTLFGGAVGPAEGVRDLGFLPEQDKYDAYAAAALLCQPSLIESFSLALMEAWAAGTPALVHAGCAVTRDHCLRARAGLSFADYAEFAADLDLLLARPDLRARLGANGRAYVRDNYHWDVIVERYRALLAELAETVPCVTRVEAT